MANFVFPLPDTGDFEAPNGLTYSHDGVKWVVKSLRGSAELKDELDGIEVELRKLELSLEELEITKGSVARYQVKGISMGIASRNGELYVNNAKAEDVTAVSFALFDLNGQPTRPTAKGDIIEFVETTRDVGEVTRYRIISGDDPQALTVEYLSGKNNFEVDDNEEVYIYPQNEESASKEYVDTKLEEKVGKAGDEMSGALVIDSSDTALNIKSGKTVTSDLIKSTRNTGYAFEVKPEDKTQISYIHTNGSFAFGGDGAIKGNLDITSPSTGVRIYGNLKVKKEGMGLGGANIFEVFGTNASYYGAITADDHVATKKYVDDNAGSGGGVEVYNGPNPPNGKDRGTLLLTSNNALYIYM